MKHRPTVSVCMPVYQGADYISQAISSVLAQSFADYELIVGDNASTDGTAEIVCSFADPRIRYVKHEVNLGYRQNVFRLIHELAKGTYVVILCADDCWNGDILTEELEVFKRHPTVTFVHAGALIWDEVSGVTQTSVRYEPKMRGFDFFQMMLREPTPVALSGVMFPRELAGHVGAFDDPRVEFAPDMELWAKLALRGDVGFVQKPLVSYRWHENNLSNSFRYRSLLEINLYFVHKLLTLADSLRPLKVDLRTLRIQATRLAFRTHLNAAPYFRAIGSINRVDAFNALLEVVRRDTMALVSVSTIARIIGAVCLPATALKQLRNWKAAATARRHPEKY